MANEQSNTESLGDRIKDYEQSYEEIIPRTEHLIVRIDGHHFSSFTKGFKKPFDKAITNAMIATTKDLHERFNCYSSYTQSDEITLFVPSPKFVQEKNLIKAVQNHIFSGRTNKISSLCASYATMCFNKYLNEEFKKERMEITERWEDSFRMTEEERDDRRTLRRFDNKLENAYFDARCFGVESLEEVYNVFLFRGRDCIKNSKSVFSQAYVPHKELQNKNGEEQIKCCLEKTGHDWNSLEDKYKFGTLIKKELYDKPVEFRDLDYSNRSKYNTPEQPMCTRSRLVELYVSLNEFNTTNVQLIANQYK